MTIMQIPPRSQPICFSEIQAHHLYADATYRPSLLASLITLELLPASDGSGDVASFEANAAAVTSVEFMNPDAAGLVAFRMNQQPTKEWEIQVLFPDGHRAFYTVTKPPSELPYEKGDVYRISVNAIEELMKNLVDKP